MSTLPTHVDDFHTELEHVRDQLRGNHLSAVRELLSDSVVFRACAEIGLRFRKRVLTPVITVLHMIATSLCSCAGHRCDGSFRASWNLFGCESVSTAALSHARGRLPEELWQRLHGYVSALAAEASTPWSVWRGHRVVDIDGTCVSTEDNPELREEFGVNKSRSGPTRYPLARMVGAILWGGLLKLLKHF